MIKQISVNSVENKNVSSKKEPSFGDGPLGWAVSALQICEANPMVNVTVLDLSTAIIPRTVVETQTNPDAGFEAFRRESSGLVINCLIPGLIVAGVAKLAQGSIMGKGSHMANCWANEDTIELITKNWKDAKGTNEKEKVADTIKKILTNIKGVDGDKEVNFKDFENHVDFKKSIEELTEETINPKPKKSWFETRAEKKAIKETPLSRIIKHTHASENIKIGDSKEYFSQGLGSIVENLPKILRELKAEKISGTFAKNASKLVTTKSLLGLGLIIPLAISAQPINRWITAKTSGKKGAPIYKDFEHSKSRELSPQEKASLAKQKIISVGSMIGVALLSIGKKPSKAMWKSVTQFKGIFPTMDQARIISATTFASRMASSEDKNELREATFRDIATFGAFYYIGDYVAKATASIIQKAKPHIKLINDLAPLKADEKKNLFKRAMHWMQGTALKSSDELYGATKNATKEIKNMRGVCQLVNILVSLVALGLVIPKMYRTKTDKEREKELKQMGVDQKTIDKYYPAFEAASPSKNETTASVSK